MRRVSYQSVLQRAVSLYLGTAVIDDEAAAAALNVHINKRAVECWESFAWPEWCPTEMRTFRAPWEVGTTYAAGDEVFHQASGLYGIALRASTAQPPFLLSGGSYAANTAYWGALESSYSANEYEAGTIYSQGDRVFYRETGKFYQLWYASVIGVAPTDATKWGELARFRKNIELDQDWEETVMGDVLGMWDDDPDTSAWACEVPYRLAPDGAVCRPGAPGQVWVKFRERAPEWSGVTKVAGTTYAEGATVYDAGEGDYFTALSATATAVTDATKWVRVEFPYVLRDAVAQLAYADALRGDGMNEKAAGIEVGEGFRCLRREFDKIERQQKQHRQMPVKTR